MLFWKNRAINNRVFYQADGTTGGGDGQTGEKGAGDSGEGKSKLSFTDEQQKHIDGLIAKQYAKLQAQADEKVKAIEEAEKLKGMSEAERTVAELEKYKKQLADYERKDLVSQFKLELTGKGLPGDFAEHIPVGDAEKAKAAVDFLSKYKSDIEKPLADKVKQLEEELKNANLRGTPPKAPGGTAAAKPIPHIF